MSSSQPQSRSTQSSGRKSLGEGPFPHAPLAQPATHVDNGSNIIFSVQGSHIVNDRGERIVLKGFARPSLEWNPQGQFLSEEELKCMKSKWNANVVRLSLNQNYWFESGPVTEIGSYKQIINALVYYAGQHQMAVILDLHWTENGHQSCMPNKQSLHFWEQVAMDYKDFGTVLFELFNEPKDVSPQVWLQGDNKTHIGYQTLYDTVRNKAGAQNICIINGLDWGYDLSFVDERGFLVKGTNIVYGSHPYNEKMKNFTQNFQGVLHKYPLILTEFGVNQECYFPEGYESVYKQILGFCDQYEVSYTAWAWWVEDGDAKKANVFPTIVKDWSGTPLNGGVFIQQDMQRLPGTEIK
jgi:hypothetical protein